MQGYANNGTLTGFGELIHWQRIYIEYFLSFPQKNLSPEKTEMN